MTGTTEKNLDTLRLFFLAVVEKHKDIFPNERVFEFTREWVSLKHEWLAGQRARFALGIVSLGLRHPNLTLHRLRMALPSLPGNAVFGRFSRELG